MGKILKFKQKPGPLAEIEHAANDIVSKLEYLVEGQDHINVTLGIMLVDDEGRSMDITLSNQSREIKKIRYEPGANPTLNEALDQDK